MRNYTFFNVKNPGTPTKCIVPNVYILKKKLFLQNAIPNHMFYYKTSLFCIFIAFTGVEISSRMPILDTE